MCDIDTSSAPMASRSAAVQEILTSASQFSEASIAPLEEHLKAQVKDKTYDFAANKALVKLYQFSPQRCQLDILAKAFTKALMARPSNDMSSLLYMCPEVLADGDNTLRRLKKCDELLESSKFAEFWAGVRESTAAEASIVALCPGFEPALRRFIVELISTTFESVDVDFLAVALGVDAAAAQAVAANPPKNSPFVAAAAGAGVANFAANADNQCRQQRSAKKVQLESLLGLYNTKLAVF
ncbi:armadillo-type protein [Pelagophyceae sp. CCMP2097]|nr:armadillo-type protein [Pelagophyceae sp. CCMP2097]